MRRSHEQDIGASRIMDDQTPDESTPASAASERYRMSRRGLLQASVLVAGTAAVMGAGPVFAAEVAAAQVAPLAPRKGQVGFVLSHEQFTVPQLLTFGKAA